MFRATKKKPRKVIRTSVEHNNGSDQEETGQRDPTIVIRRKKKKAKDTGMTIRSVRMHGDEEDESPRYKKRRRKGLGFGGAAMHVPVDGEEDNSNKEQKSDSEAPSYGKEALEKLKAHQRTKPKTEETTETETKTESTQDSGNALAKAIQAPAPEITPNNNQGEASSALPSFIPINDGNDLDETVVLTGEEAMQMQMQTAPTFYSTESKDTLVQELDNPDESSAWEAQITRRAGLQPSQDPKPSSSSKLPSLGSLRHQLQSTFENIQSQQQDLDHAIMRREADLAQTESDLKRQQQALHEAGNACNDYQRLRHTLAMWVGALRDLQQKVEPILEALIQIILSQYKAMQQEWINWQDDVVSTLQDVDKLDQVVGRQPQLPPADEMATAVDEFGRDIQSQYLREREKRYRSRIRRQEMESGQGGDGSDEILSCIWIDEQDRQKRYDVLQEALRVALSDLEQDYTSISKLVGVFAEWKETYLDEYRQCYANICLGDLASVLVQVELCRSSWVFRMLRQRKNVGKESLLFSWIPELFSVDKQCLEDEEGAIQRVLGKNFVPFLLSLLIEAPALCFLSPQKSQLLRSFVNETITNLGKKSKEATKVEESLFKAITDVLGKVSIPLVKGGLDSMGGGREKNDQVHHAVNFAKVDQGTWIQRLLLNLLRDWVPFLQHSPKYDEVGECVLDFISSYLFLLSSLSPGLASEMFSPIWQVLKSENNDWLESPSLLLQGAPIRAAAAAYGLS
jgi:hypothetical protein